VQGRLQQKTRSRSVDVKRKRAEKLTESEQGEEGDDESRALHVERVEVERRGRKVLSLKAAENRGEKGQMGDPNLRKSPV